MSGDAMNVAKVVAEYGFACYAQFSLGSTTEQVARSIGEPIALSNNSPVHFLTPKRKDEATPNTYSGQYGLGEFPLHTDMANWHQPPRYLMLRCVVGAISVATTLFDPRSIISIIGVENLARALMKPRRTVAGRTSLLPLVQHFDGGTLLRWDERYLEPASRMGEVYATELRNQLRTVEPTNVTLSQSGDTILIDNWRMLHGRTCVPEDCRSRLIERVYLGNLS